MSAAQVLEQARAAGVTLWSEGDVLRFHGPREALTDELRSLIREHKAALVEDPNTDPVATPDGTCELLIPKDRYDPFAVLELVQDPDPARLWWRVVLAHPHETPAHRREVDPTHAVERRGLRAWRARLPKR